MINLKGVDEIYRAICKTPGITLDGLVDATPLLYPIDVVMQLRSREIIVWNNGYRPAEDAERKLRELKEDTKRE